MTVHCNVTREAVYEMNELLGESGCQVCGLPASMHDPKRPEENRLERQGRAWAEGYFRTTYSGGL